MRRSGADFSLASTSCQYGNCLLCSVVLALACWLSLQGAQADTGPFLKANGRDIRNGQGQGDVVSLRGANLGSWLLMEGWMCPMDSSGLTDNYAVVQTLNTRFGVATQEALIKTYQEAWITTNDLDNIKNLGMNCVRLPFWWGNVQRLDGTWRADAFEKMDWLVTNAWQRGIYTIIDFHGIPGGQSSSDTTAQANQNLYWTSAVYQSQTSLIWSNVAAHFNGNPAVAGYDLINEPFGAPTQLAIWTAYNNLYQTVRSADPDHMIIMEGCWSGPGLNWEWAVLPPPSQFNWTNVVYSMHAYAGTQTASGEKSETDKQVADFNNHQSWNLPCLIGEFNSHGTQAAWPYSVQQYNQNNMSWLNWAYKAIAGGVGNSWGIYDPTGTWPAKPNIQSDLSTTISNDWSQWKTSAAFGVTPFLRQYLSAPIAVADFYTNSGSSTFNVTSNAGVLANDQDINLSTLTAVLVNGPINGQLTLNTNGSFSYLPNSGFTGTDTFRYRVSDGYVSSVNLAVVSIKVVGITNAGPVSQFIWTTQPGLATNGFPFGQQPELRTADASGNPSVLGLAATQYVVVSLASSAPFQGSTSYNIGTAGSNGVVSFRNLGIDSVGTNQLIAASLIQTPVSPLINGNFNLPASTAAPTGWTTWSYGAGYASHQVITPIASVKGDYDGSYQMTFGAANTTDGGGVYQIVPVSAGMICKLTADSGVQNWWWPWGEMRLFFLDANANGLSTNVLSVTAGISGYDIGKPCQPYQLTATAPASATQVKVELAGYGGGSVWFDNAVLTESNSLPTLGAATTLPFVVYSPAPVSQTNYVAAITDSGNGTFTLHFVGTTGVSYYVQTTTNLTPPVVWVPVAGSTNLGPLWSCTVTNTVPQKYYRSAVVNP